jgi:N-acetylmuramoyl-L-alanine amidase
VRKIFILFWSVSITILLFFIFSSYPKTQFTVAYKYGSRGTTVRQIQTRLKSWGYYKGNVDGIYGYQTTQAVKYFQRTHGLKADGVAGTRTLAAIGIRPGAGATSAKTATGSQNTGLMSRAINGESRGEPYIGQVAVGAVIMNRVRDPRFPNTIAGVVYQTGAFTAVSDGQIHAALEESPTRAANDALNGWDPSGGAVYYYNPATATNKWIWSRPVIKRIGKHVFCN